MKQLVIPLDEKMIGDSIEQNRKIWVVTDSKGLAKLTETCKPENVYPFDAFHVAILNARFINPKTRQSALIRRYILELH